MNQCVQFNCSNVVLVIQITSISNVMNELHLDVQINLHTSSNNYYYIKRYTDRKVQ